MIDWFLCEWFMVNVYKERSWLSLHKGSLSAEITNFTNTLKNRRTKEKTAKTHLRTSDLKVKGSDGRAGLSIQSVGRFLRDLQRQRTERLKESRDKRTSFRRHHGLQHVCGQTSGGAVQDHVPGKTSEHAGELLTNQMCFIKGRETNSAIIGRQ